MMNEPPQQYCLRWHKHTANFVESFESLLDNEALVDVTLFAEGQLVKAHKVVLSACSLYFETLFAQTRDKHPIVILKDVKVDHLKALLDFMYKGHVNVSHKELDPLLQTAKELNIKGLADGLKEKTEVQNMVPMSLVRPVNTNSHYPLPPSTSHGETKPLHRPPPNIYDSPSVSVPSVLSTALTMPSALSMTTPLSIPHLSSLPHSLASSIVSSLSNASPRISHSINSFHPSHNVPVQSDGCESPFLKRRRKHRRRSGEGLESGDSDGRSSGSPGDSMSNLNFPRIPATITPISVYRQHQQQQELQQLQQQQQPRDLSMHSSNNHYNSQTNSHSLIALKSPQRQPANKPSSSINSLFLPPPPVENNHKSKNEHERMDSQPVQPDQRYIKPECRVGQETTDEKSSSPESISDSLKRDEEKGESQRPSPKNGSDPESLASPTKGSATDPHLDETSSDNNHYSDDELDENSNGLRERYSEHLSDSTPGPSTSRPHSEEAPNTPNYLGWPYTSDPASADEAFAHLAENSNHGFWKNSFKGGLLAPYLGTPLAPIPHSPHSHGLTTTFPGLYANPCGPPPGWGRGSASPPNSSLPPHLRSNECSRCGRLYKTRKGLKHHIKNECGVEPRFQCTHCDWKFKQKAHLLRHMARKHTFS